MIATVLSISNTTPPFPLLAANHSRATGNLAAGTATVLLVRETLRSHDSLLHITEQHDMRVEEEQGNDGTNEVHEEDNGKDCFDRKTPVSKCIRAAAFPP